MVTAENPIYTGPIEMSTISESLQDPVELLLYRQHLGNKPGIGHAMGTEIDGDALQGDKHPLVLLPFADYEMSSVTELSDGGVTNPETLCRFLQSQEDFAVVSDSHANPEVLA